MHLDVSFLNLPRELAKDRGLTVVEYGAQRAAPHPSNVAWMLTVEKIEQAPVLMEAPSLQDLVKPYRGQYKTTVESKTVAKSRTWLVVKVR